MCTLFYHKSQGILAKMRDKNVPTEEEVLATVDVLAVRTKGADYYGLGVNARGCAFVSAAINSPAWTEAAECGDATAAAAIHAEENSGLTSPSVIVSQSLGRAVTVANILQYLEEHRLPWMGYNLVLADSERAVAVEVYKNEMNLRELDESAAVTNHFDGIKTGPLEYVDYPSSFERLKVAEVFLETVPGEGWAEAFEPGSRGQYPFWRDGNFFTVSASLIHFRVGCLEYLARGENGFQEFTFSPSAESGA